MISKINDKIEFVKEQRFDFERAAELQESVWEGGKSPVQPLLLSCHLDEDELSDFPIFDLKEIHYDRKKMFADQFRLMMSAVHGGAEAVPSVRANMGCGIFPTLFGIEQELFEDKMPWVQEHLSKEELAMMGPEDIEIGDEFRTGLDHMEYMAERLEGTGCLVYPMDLQGPFDIAHLVYGDAIFYDLYDDPRFVHHLLELACHAIFVGMDECFKRIRNCNKRIAHYNELVLPRSVGGIKTSEDTATLLSKAHIEEFVVPYLIKVLSHFGGGYVHYCGQNPYLFEAVMNLGEVKGINLGNPEMHDMEYVLRRCADTGKIYYGGIPQKDEVTEDYFTRYLRASKTGDRSVLLMSYRCEKQDRQMILDAWDRACRVLMEP